MQAPECQLRQLFVGENPMVDCGRDARAVQAWALACACAASERSVGPSVAEARSRYASTWALHWLAAYQRRDTCAEAKEGKEAWTRMG